MPRLAAIEPATRPQHPSRRLRQRRRGDAWLRQPAQRRRPGSQLLRGPQLKVRPRDGEHTEEFDLEILGYDDCELLKPEVVECSKLLTTRLG